MSDRFADQPRLITRLAIAACLLAFGAASSYAAEAPVTSWMPQAASSPSLPDPIYWRQVRFLIPYQLNSGADPAAAQAVSLHVSKNSGQSWQQISQAEPQLRAFTYHAEADGEYWFAIRTSDGRGAFWPTGPMQPQLRVIVDTTVPRFEALTGAVRADGSLDISWRVFDTNLDPNSWRVEYQTGAGGNWEAAPLAGAPAVVAGVCEGHSTVPAASGRGVVAIRATVYDRAGNRATYQSSVAQPTSGDPVAIRLPTIISGRGGDVPIAPTPSIVTSAAEDGAGWTSSSPTRTVAPSVLTSQLWPPDRTSKTSFLFAENRNDTTRPRSETNEMPNDAADHMATNSKSMPIPEPIKGNRPLGTVPAQPQPVNSATDPFRTVSRIHPARADSEWPAEEASAPVSTDSKAEPVSPPRVDSAAKANCKLVNSRSFALEYQLEDVSSRGVSKVELWGTRDAGKNWRIFAVDDDNHSSLTVTVDGEGRYGFRIVVEGVGGIGAFPPQSGDEPELWVDVDLHRPLVRFNAIENGRGDLSGQLVVRWDVDDDNLDDRPIALFYSSRPSGPWSAITSRIPNSGEYHWRLERHVPPHIYLRLEARDTAGNMAACQTKQAIVLESSSPIARLEPAIESTESISASSANQSSR